MNPKTSRPKTKKRTKKRRFALELAGKELFLWLGVVFLALVWMFTLGVIVGRGLSPVEFDVEKLKKELIAFKEEALKKEAKAKAVPPSDKSHLGFYDALTDKKEEARLKSLPKLRKRPVREPVQGYAVNRDNRKGSEAPIPIKTSVVKKQVKTRSLSSGGSFTLQVASLKDLAKAEKMVATLKKTGFAAYAVSAHVSGSTYHRVRVGHFADQDETKATAARLRAEKLAPIVVQEK